jgi:hypothetical protein
MPAMKIFLSVFLLITIHFSVQSEQLITNLYGFELGQFRQVTSYELGKVFLSHKYEDGFEYEMFLLKPDSSLYIVFEYSPTINNVIWSIQLTGSNGETNFGNVKLKLGMDKLEVEKTVGKPSEIKSIDNVGDQWIYKNQNFSFEISPKGKLSSIKIKDIFSNKTPDNSAIPNYIDLIHLLNSNTNIEISSALAPDVEIYYEGKTIYFQKSLSHEILSDESKIFETIRLLRDGLEKINTKDTVSYEENIHNVENHFPMHVIKIKNGHPIKEIVLKFWNGKYLIWEIKT